jgi:4-amino-4-deoxy-L-arabinose transferase-like glycosyltransferase
VIAAWRGRAAAERRVWLALAAITLAALALRVVWVLYTDTYPAGGDPHWYYNVATNIARGKGVVADHYRTIFDPDPVIGEPTAAWPPAFSFLLAGLWQITGISNEAAKLLNAALGAATVPFVYLLARRLFSTGAGLLAAGVFAVFPNAIAWTPVLFPEQLFTLLFVFGLWLLVAAMSAERPRTTALAFGAIAGLAIFTRGEGAVLLAAGALFWLHRDGWRRGAGLTALAAGAAVVVLLPWTVRNRITMGAWIPVATNSGVALRIGHSPWATGTTDVVTPPEPVDGVPIWEHTYHPETEVRSYREYTRRAVKYALTHPRRELDLSRWKVYHLYRSDAWVVEWVKVGSAQAIHSAALEDALWRLFEVSHYVLMFAAVGTAAFWLRWSPGRLLLANTVLVWTAFHIVISAEPRYHVPLFPVFAVAAAGGVVLAGRAATTSWRRFRDGADATPHGLVAEGAEGQP